MDLGLDSLLAMGIAATLQSRLRLEPGTTEGGPALDQETILTLILQEPTPRAASLRLCGLANAAAAEPSFEAPPWLRGLSQLDLTRLAHRGMLRGPLRPSGRVAYYLPGAPGVCLVEFALHTENFAEGGGTLKRAEMFLSMNALFCRHSFP